MPSDSADPAIPIAPAVPGGQGRSLAADYAAAALRAMSEGVVVQVAGGEIVSCNPAAERILGLTRDQMAGLTSVDPRWRAVHEDGSPFPGETHPVMVTLRTGEALRDVIMGVHTPEGSLRWISINSELVPGSGERPASVVTTFIDVSDRKLTDEAARRDAEAIRRSEEKYRRIVDTANEGIWQIDAESKLTFVNRRMAEMLGYTPEEMVGRTPVDFVVADEQADAEQRIAEAAQGLPESHERRLARKDGSEVWVQLARSPVLSPDGSFDGVLAMVMDVTVQKRLDDARREEQERTRVVLDNSSEAILLTDPNGIIITANPEAARIFRRTQEEICGRGRSGIMDSNDPRLRAALAERDRTGEFRGELNCVRGDGSIFPAEVRSRVFTDPSGRQRTSTAIRDITERKRLEAALNEAAAATARASELEAVMDAAPAIIFLAHDPSCERMTINWAGRRILGLTTGDNASMSAPPEERPTTFRPVKDGREVPPEELPVQRAAKGHPVKDAEVTLEMSDGTTRVIVGDAVPLFDRKGALSGAVGAFRDVTELKRVEEELRASRVLFETVFRLNPSPMTIRAWPAMTILNVNDAFQKATGHDGEEVRGKTDLGFRGTGTGARYKEIADLLDRRGSFRDVEMEVVRANGQIQYGLFSGEVIQLEGRQVLVSAMQDVTEQRLAEAALRGSEEKFRLLAENATDLIGRIGPDGLIRYVSPSCKSLLGYDQDEMTGRSGGDLVAPGDRTAAQADISRLAAGESLVRGRYHAPRKDGTSVWVESVSRPVRDSATGEVIEIQFSVRDISEAKEYEAELRRHREQLEEVVAERNAALTKTNADLREVIAAHRRTEKELRESEERLHLAQEVGHSGAYEWDVRTNEVLWTPELERLYGLPAGGFAGRYGSWETFVHPADLLKVNGLAQKAVEERTGFRSEFRITRLDGETRWLELVGKVFCDESGEALRVIGLNRDVTERKLADERLRASEEAMRESRRKLDAAFDSMTDAIFISDASGQFIEFNDAFATFHRFQNKAECARHLSDYHEILDVFMDTGELAPLEMWMVPRALRGETVENAEYTLRLKATGETWVGSYNFGPIRDKDGTIVGSVVVGSDITERKKIEARVLARTAALVEANRELEGYSYSVSHELRTPLRAIDGFTAMISRHLGDLLDHEGRRLLGEVRWNAQRMGQLIDDLLEFSRIGRTDLSLTSVDMTAAARAALAQVKSAPGIPARASMLVGDLPDAYGDAGLLRRVWRSLLSNAVKFSGGRKEPEIHVEGSIQGDEVVYRVRDNGVGFDMKYVAKLFGIFHRLQGIHEYEGTGVGLALVRRIVVRHGGRVWAEGELDRGATFSFALPVKPRSGISASWKKLVLPPGTTNIS